MHRTQMFLEDIQYRDLREMAQRERKSLGKTVRDIIDDYLAGRRAKKDPFAAVIGVGAGPRGNVSERYKDVLYGQGKA